MIENNALPLASTIFNQLGISLYIHYPFCVRKCPYCDFASEALEVSAKLDHVYISALILEFKRKVVLLGNSKLISVFMGGGTPSLCSTNELVRLLDAIKPYLHPQAEVSIEVNPCTVSEEKLKELRHIGFNRISIGVQSFNNLALKRLGRVHDSKQAYNACKLATRYFDEVNIDIMHGLPRQDTDLALSDLIQAVDFAPTHLSWYELTIEEGTAFGEHPPVLPHEDILYEIEQCGNAFLESSGYFNYEVSAYNKSDKHRCVHNLNYWLYGDYLGIGAAAHQKISRIRASINPNTNLMALIDHDWRNNPECFVETTLCTMGLEKAMHEKFKDKPLSKYDMVYPLAIYRTSNPESYRDYLIQQVHLAHLDGSVDANYFILEAISADLPVEINFKSSNLDNGNLLSVQDKDKEEQSHHTQDFNTFNLSCLDRKVTEDENMFSYSSDADASGNIGAVFLDFVSDKHLPENFDKIAGHLVDAADIPFEYMLNRLRLINDPFSLKDFNFRTGLPPTFIQKELLALARIELLNISENYLDPSADQTISLSQDGKRMLNEVINSFLPDD